MIRPGTIDDVNRVVELAIDGHSKSPYRNIPYDETEIRRNVLLSVTMPVFCCFVAESEERVTAALVGSVGKNVWGALVASDQGIYADSPGDGLKLVDRFLLWAKDSGAAMVSMTNSFGDKRYDNVLKKKYGLIHTGGNFIGEL